MKFFFSSSSSSGTEKKFHRKRMKNDEIRAFFERQILIRQPNISNYSNLGVKTQRLDYKNFSSGEIVKTIFYKVVARVLRIPTTPRSPLLLL